MKHKYKIFCLKTENLGVPPDHRTIVMKPLVSAFVAQIPGDTDEFDTLDSAEHWIDKHGGNSTKYVVLKVYN